MAVKGNDIADFFRQLSLLSRAELPLPEGIQNMVISSSKREFKRVLENISRDIAAGQKLSAAMRNQKQLFTEYQIRLIETGEKTGTLHEVMWEVADSARMNSRINQTFRSACLYPAIVLFLTLAITIGLYYFVIGGFADIYGELLEGEPLPGITDMVINVGEKVRAHIAWVCLGFVAFAVFKLEEKKW